MGLASVRRDKTLPGIDRMKTSIFGRAEFDGGTHVAAKGGAVRANSHWYALTFDCRLTPHQMKAIAFTYTLGREILESEWDNLGRWR